MYTFWYIASPFAPAIINNGRNLGMRLRQMLASWTSFLGGTNDQGKGVRGSGSHIMSTVCPTISPPNNQQGTAQIRYLDFWESLMHCISVSNSSKKTTASHTKGLPSEFGRTVFRLGTISSYVGKNNTFAASSHRAPLQHVNHWD